MARPKNTNTALTEEQILEKAFDVFSQYGYRGSTTKMLADASGVNEITLFRHFDSKENLFKKVIEHYSFLARIEELEPKLEHLSYTEALELLAGSFIDNLYRNKNLVRIMTTEAYNHPTHARMIYKNLVEKVFKHFVNYLGKFSKSRKLRKFDSPLAARAFFGMFFFYFMNQEFFFEKEIKKFNQKHVVREYVQLFLKGTVNDERGK
ncbi:MAG: TetR/AcrR family transcriptional regulator [Candidatus Schekmanbacteria bacterium]|nr:TetR/AcrR family transcriptional regulator [Candidatus Schekmanbacteria bacterium]